MAGIDCIYVAASARDGRFTRICIASIRQFYPRARLQILAGGPLQPGLASELRRYWDVDIADFPKGDYGWGFVKLEPLFGREGERFLMLDSDTVVTGPVLDLCSASEAPLIVDDEVQPDIEIRRIYYDWEKLAQIEPALRPAFVFNSGQWFGTGGVLSRTDFAPWIEWDMPRRVRRPDIFKNGDQGILNYVLNRKSAAGEIAVGRTRLMRWPGHSMKGLDAHSVASGLSDPLVVHWAGLKKQRLSAMPGADLLRHFESAYYARLPGGSIRRRWNAGRLSAGNWTRDARIKLRMRLTPATAARGQNP